ncbi:MAG: hypothetical protein AB7P40_09585 [Chloroflexota bacterium]
MLETFTIDTFRPCIGSAFGVEAAGVPPFEMVLEAVQEIPAAGWRPDEAKNHRIPFALQLLGPLDFVLPQQICQFRHESIGEFDMFIVPVGRSNGGVTYEAVFS